MLLPAMISRSCALFTAEAYVEIRTHLRLDEILSGACVATLYQSGVRIRSVRNGYDCGSIVVGNLWFSPGRSFAIPSSLCNRASLVASLEYGTANSDTLFGVPPDAVHCEDFYALYVIHPATAHGWMSEGSLMTKYLLKAAHQLCSNIYSCAHFNLLLGKSLAIGV